MPTQIFLTLLFAVLGMKLRARALSVLSTHSIVNLHDKPLILLSILAKTLFMGVH